MCNLTEIQSYYYTNGANTIATFEYLATLLFHMAIHKIIYLHGLEELEYVALQVTG